MQDYTGVHLPLQYLECDQAEWMLGVQLAADGNMAAEFEIRRLQAQTGAAQVTNYKADTMTHWINFTMVLLPWIFYSLMATTLPERNVSKYYGLQFSNSCLCLD